MKNNSKLAVVALVLGLVAVMVGSGVVFAVMQNRSGITPATSVGSVDIKPLAQPVDSEVISVVEPVAQAQVQPEPVETEVALPAVTTAGAEQQTNLQSLLGEGISLVTPNHTYEVSPGELGSWIDGVTWSDAMIQKKIRGIAREQDRAAVPTKVIGTTDQVVEEGSAGIKLDQEAAYVAIVTALTGGLQQRTIQLPTTVVEPERVAVASSAAPSSNSGKSVVVVLSEQRLYAWENGTLVKSFLVSTGLTGPTPVGQWAIHNKTFVQTYAGPGYYLPNVYYSSWFLPEIAIHQAYWHDNFGQPMSHGCVNARIEDAQFIYEWAPIGTPVEVVP